MACCEDASPMVSKIGIVDELGEAALLRPR